MLAFGIQDWGALNDEMSEGQNFEQRWHLAAQSKDEKNIIRKEIHDPIASAHSFRYISRNVVKVTNMVELPPASSKFGGHAARDPWTRIE
ncbi:hypothetical protein O181_059837 [Austropuccinia psidii MF-1]|uniref:Uncharacterized protein n=1 Tax=Austropuccinia psidii MF-1 TaxID=1389203 RepID=A0A9Q3HXT3_9BASI|nr:hypothetical protein [Austropuccinia psidii MF-1]